MPALYTPNRILSSLVEQEGFEKPQRCVITSAVFHPSPDPNKRQLELVVLDAVQRKFQVRYDLTGATVNQQFLTEGGALSTEDLMGKTVFLYQQSYLPKGEKRGIMAIRNALSYYPHL